MPCGFELVCVSSYKLAFSSCQELHGTETEGKLLHSGEGEFPGSGISPGRRAKQSRGGSFRAPFANAPEVVSRARITSLSTAGGGQ